MQILKQPAKIAILIDWENLRREIIALQKKRILSRDDLDYNNPKHIYNLVTSQFNNTNYSIFRIFFYTAFPLQKDEIKRLSMQRKDIDFAKYEDYYNKNQEKIINMINNSKRLFKELDKKDNVAIRLGNLQIQAQKEDGNIIFTQKKVDMLIGLDTAHLSYNKIVDEIVFFCKDKDLSPAFKLARINGLNVSLVDIGGINISDNIYKHIDKTYTVTPDEIKQKSRL
ncbi:MAG: NYN domain-containing protein [Epsilonproteobacteria bacterium]|nr:NYN domain-containing protein [Campylobacterota bacterium]